MKIGNKCSSQFGWFLFNYPIEGGDGTHEVRPNPKPIKTWKRWGPSYEIKLEVEITKFSGRIVYFGSNDLDYGVPLIVARDYRLIITTQVHGQEIQCSTNEIRRNTFYTVTIAHKPSSGDSSKVFHCKTWWIFVFEL